MPLCVRMLNLVMLADSSAMLASRIRLSAALLLTDLRLRQADGERQPVLERADRCPARCRAADGGRDGGDRGRRVGRRVDREAVDVEAGGACRPRAIVPPTTPLAPSLLTNTEKPAAVEPGDVRFAVDFRRARPELGVQLGAVDADADEADWVASVESRSSRLEMLLSAPSLICRVDSPSLALRMPWLRTAWVER